MSPAEPQSDNPSDLRHRSPVVWRENDPVVYDRSRGVPLPPVCQLTGEPTPHRVTCLFHFRDSLLEPAHSPAMAVVNLIHFYLYEVAKAKVAVPLAPKLYRRWILGWCLTGLMVLLAIATIVGLLWGQAQINALPKGETRQFLNDLGIPLLALGGFASIGILLVIITRIMPMLTTRLIPRAITPTHIWLAGACAGYLAQLPEQGDGLIVGGPSNPL